MARCIKTYEEFGNVPRTFQGEKRSLSEHFFLEDARDEPNDLLETAEEILRPKQKTLSPKLCTEAAARGCVKTLKTLREDFACPWDQTTCEYAALNGHLECLEYAHENGCSWDELTCCFAASGGHLECLKYAHENGCPWDCLLYTSDAADD